MKKYYFDKAFHVETLEKQLDSLRNQLDFLSQNTFIKYLAPHAIIGIANCCHNEKEDLEKGDLVFAESQPLIIARSHNDTHFFGGYVDEQSGVCVGTIPKIKVNVTNPSALKAREADIN